ncbi:plasmid mobilization relaxosome protein MobC [Burkholderia pseudomallei]|nr:plasmid mobilization relaxosome protein MobC [Burkholderia pseudomallei]QUN98238.1 plasmid mobilization relaxosome protein MobC [Burkholderia pseudomallei]QUO04077.1 plasmid mobilization relaxosome protein MobC [Burkholderia pseudomallei]
MSVRLNTEELLTLDGQRGRTPRGAYLRRMWSGAKLPRLIPAANADALDQLRGIASNLNQLARHANAAHTLELAALAATVGDLRKALAGLR